LTEEERLCGWFQQYSATVHTARMSMETLSEFFGNRIIRSGIWPARLRELKSYDFFFCVCLKGKVHNSNPRTEKELKESNLKETENMPAE
jgi:hypothetical protein